MRKITFDEEELFAIAVFEPGSREETAAKMSGVLEELTEDPDMHALIVSASEKLKRISDKEFEELDIDGYREELAWEETEEYEEDSESATDSENPGEESRIHNGIQNATEAASEAEKDNTRNVGSSTPANSAGTAQKTEKEGSQAKNKAGGDT